MEFENAVLQKKLAESIDQKKDSTYFLELTQN